MNGLPDQPKEEEGYFIAHGRKLSVWNLSGEESRDHFGQIEFPTDIWWVEY
jgi:hypothetical protein